MLLCFRCEVKESVYTTDTGPGDMMLPDDSDKETRPETQPLTIESEKEEENQG
jgi:hypothetical protein